MVLGMALDLRELPSSRGGDKCAHRFCALERRYLGQWGKEGREQKLSMLSSGPSSQPLPKLFVALKHFPPKDIYAEMLMDTESVQQSRLDSSGYEPSCVLERTSLYGLFSLLENKVVRVDSF